MTKTYGVEEARQALPTLLDRALEGQSTIITRHGRPVAAVVPVDQVHVHGVVGMAALQGTGTGLWSGADAVDPQRDEWG